MTRFNIGDNAAALARADVRREDEAHWSRDHVRWRMRRGAYIIVRMERSPRPARRLTFWPDVSLFAHMDAFDRNARQEGYSLRTRDPDRSRETFTPSEISDAEAAAHWLQDYLSAPSLVRPRKAVQLYLWCDMHRLPVRDYCERIGLRKSATYEFINKGLDVILAGVVKDGVKP